MGSTPPTTPGGTLWLSKQEAFVLAFKWVLKAEGAYSNDPEDPGGETVYGISQRWLNDVEPTKRVTDLELREIQELYRQYFWYPAVNLAALHGDGPKVVLTLFDIAVNQGFSRAKMWYQIALGLPKARRQLALTYERLRHYSRLARARPEMGRAFLRGWLNRVLDLLDYLDGLGEVEWGAEDETTPV